MDEDVFLFSLGTQKKNRLNWIGMKKLRHFEARVFMEIKREKK